MLTLLLALNLVQPDVAALRRAESYVAQTDGQAMLVMHRGRVIHEAYFDGGAVGKRQMLASGSKSFVGVATIAAVQDGLMQLDAPVARYVPEWQGDVRKSRVTVRQLLSLEGGVESGNPGTGCGGRGGTWTDVLNAGTFAEPGTVFRYGPFPFITMGAALERVQSASFEAYLNRRVLEPLGVQVEWRAKCGDGKPQLAGGAAMTARDWGTFGEMIRLGGVHQGRRILDERLVRELFRPSGSNPTYGLSWWLVGATLLSQPAAGLEQGNQSRRGRILGNRRGRLGRGGAAEPANRSAQMPPWMPTDLVMAAGAGKQRLYVIPSRELVIVRLGSLLGGRRFTDVEFLGALFGAV
ncbi:MAG: beta-lactamase family protein [Gemmatimonas sp.]|nr:beta-lactamase family protein [Gemmatimonas sp.]